MFSVSWQNSVFELSIDRRWQSSGSVSFFFFVDMVIRPGPSAVTYGWRFFPDTSSACQNLATVKQSPPLPPLPHPPHLLKCLVAIAGSIFSCTSATPVLLTTVWLDIMCDWRRCLFLEMLASGRGVKAGLYGFVLSSPRRQSRREAAHSLWGPIMAELSCKCWLKGNDGRRSPGPRRASEQPPAATCSAPLCHAPLSKLTQKRVARLLPSQSRGLLGVLPMWIEYPHRSPRASTLLHAPQ